MKSFRSGLFPVDIKVDGVRVKNSPIALDIMPTPKPSPTYTEINTDDGSLDFWSPGKHVLVITPRDEFDNIIKVTASNYPELTPEFNITAELDREKKDNVDIVFTPMNISSTEWQASYDGLLVYEYSIPSYETEVRQLSLASRLYLSAICSGTGLNFNDRDGSQQTLDGEYKIPPRVIRYVRGPSPSAYRYTMFVYGLTTSFITIVAALAFYWKKENAIKFSQKRILFIILFGSFLFDASNSITSIQVLDEMAMSCKVQLFGSIFGCWLVLLCIIAKSYRVIKLAYNTGHKVRAL